MSEPSSPAICFDVEAFRREAEAARHLWVQVERTLEAQPSSLEQHLKRCVDEELERRGALRRSQSVPDELCERLTDQLYRARLLGFDGLSLELQCLSAFAREGILGDEDSRGLRRWCSAARSGLVRLALGPGVLALRGYDEPVELRLWFAATDEQLAATGLASSTERDERGGDQERPSFDDASFDDALDALLGVRALTASDAPDAAIGVDSHRTEIPDESLDDNVAETLDESGGTDVTEAFDGPHAMDVAELHDESDEADVAETLDESDGTDVTEAFDGAHDTDITELNDRFDEADVAETLDESGGTDVTEAFDGAHDTDVAESHDRFDEVDVAETLDEAHEADVAEALDEAHEADVDEAHEADVDEAHEADVAETLDESNDDIVVRPRRAREGDIASRQIPLFVQARDNDAAPSEVSREVTLGHQRAVWCDALARADGATSFQALEDLFVTAYAPLQEAIAADPEYHGSQREVLERWGTEFETCYRRAFDHLRTSRRRPQMVFDAPKMAFNLSRVHDAKAFHLVLVDAFRFDIGQRVYDKLRLQLSGHAECVQRGVLWSPLPSNTAAGLELLARGPDGLRDLRAEMAEAKVVSIKDARRLRKLRAGPHSLFKLDAIQALLEPGKAWSTKGLDQLAADVSVSCGRFVRQQAPGSLVFMFGDHGFRLSDGGHGGASPAEVLVPYQAWRLLEGSGSVAAE